MNPWQSRFSSYASRIAPSAIFALKTMPRAADTINLGPGEPDASLFPAAELSRVLAEVLADPETATRALQYTVNAGDPELRDRIAAYMRSQGVECSARNVLITSGSQQALDLLTALFVEPGVKVGVQAPTYPGTLGILKAHGATIDTIDELGRTPSGAAIIFATANFHNPTGTTLDVDERLALLDLAENAGAVLVEDDPYETIRFDGRRLPSMLALELRRRPIDEARSVYVSSFSKSVAPGLRVAWTVGPAAIIEQLTLMKQSEDMQAGSLVQVCLAKAMDFVTERHVPRLRQAYRVRRDAMMSALHLNFGNEVSWTKPEGGFFVWLTLPHQVDAAALLTKAALAGVTYVPGSACSHDGSFANCLRLSYSSVSLDEIAEGVRRLATVVRSAI